MRWSTFAQARPSSQRSRPPLGREEGGGALSAATSLGLAALSFRVGPFGIVSLPLVSIWGGGAPPPPSYSFVSVVFYSHCSPRGASQLSSPLCGSRGTTVGSLRSRGSLPPVATLARYARAVSTCFSPPPLPPLLSSPRGEEGGTALRAVFKLYT
jgi:hypothetical protein